MPAANDRFQQYRLPPWLPFFDPFHILIQNEWSLDVAWYYLLLLSGLKTRQIKKVAMGLCIAGYFFLLIYNFISDNGSFLQCFLYVFLNKKCFIDLFSTDIYRLLTRVLNGAEVILIILSFLTLLFLQFAVASFRHSLVPSFLCSIFICSMIG